jgi:membrane-associated protease RseP (regulator of RpoE activity)
MKTKTISLIIAVALIFAGTALCKETPTAKPRPYMGILLDTAPLPELVTKHLNLSPGQGIRIQNVQRNSAADLAGLERDDIIISINGQDVKDNETLIDAVQKAGVGTEVSLQIIHAGQRKTVNLKLGAYQENIEWKYPSEPEIEQFWQPGRLFRLSPMDKNWQEIFRENLPSDLQIDVDNFFKQIYTSRHYTDG